MLCQSTSITGFITSSIRIDSWVLSLGGVATRAGITSPSFPHIGTASRAFAMTLIVITTLGVVVDDEGKFPCPNSPSIVITEENPIVFLSKLQFGGIGSLIYELQ